MSFANPASHIDQLGLGPGMRVADFGAGAGFLSVAAAEKVGVNGTVYVIDIQPELLTKVRHYASEHHLKSMVFLTCDLERENATGLEQGSVDAVLVSNLLFQVDDKHAVLTEAFRILRPGGKVLVVDWRDSFGGIGPQPQYVLLQQDARDLVAKAGFTLGEDIDAGTYHYGFVAKKTHAQ